MTSSARLDIPDGRGTAWPRTGPGDLSICPARAGRRIRAPAGRSRDRGVRGDRRSGPAQAAARAVPPGRGRLMPDRYQIIGASRQNLTGEQFGELARQAVAEVGASPPTGAALRAFQRRLSFASADPARTLSLVEAVARAERQIGGSPGRLFQLAVSLAAFEPTVTNLGAAGLAACSCRKPRPRHATSRYSLIRSPARPCFRTWYWSGSAGSGSGFSGAAPCRERCGRCWLWWVSYSRRIRRRWAWFQMRVRSRSSRRHPPVQHSVIAFMRGVRTLHSTVRIGVGEDRAARGGEVRAAAVDHELDSARLLAEVHEEVACLLGGPLPGGCRVTPRMRMRRVACSITART